MKEFFFGDPENPIVRYNWLQLLFDLRVFVPARSIIVKVSIFDLSFAPRVAHLEQVNSRPTDVAVTFNHRVGVVVDQAASFVLI